LDTLKDDRSVHNLTFGEKIGTGMSSVVYKANHPQHGQVAVKVINPDYAEFVSEEIDFIRHAQGHPYVIRVLGTWNNGNNWYIAMDLMEGTLLDRIRRGMSADEVRDAAKQITAALLFLHTREIVHFDLKPENIGFVTNGDGRVIYKIMDFGTSEWLATTHSSPFRKYVADKDIIKTSKWYRAYETLGLGDGELTEKVDIWSLGCIIFEMLTGAPLFNNLDRSDERDVMFTIVTDGWITVSDYILHAPSQLHTQLSMVALDCLDSDVTRRPNLFTIYKQL
jgi:mitogen-activated protein kinase 15